MMRRFRAWLANPVNFAAALFALAPLVVLFRWMWFNGRNVPRFDQWRGYFIAFNAQDGTLTLADLLTPYGEQITFFSHLQTVVFTWLTDWNLWAEMWVNLALGVLVFGLYVYLFARHTPSAVALVLLPFALVVFMLRQDANWTNGYMSQWWWAQLWWLVALVILINKPDKLGWALSAGVFGFFSTISQSVGVVTWAAVLVYLVLRPCLNWRIIGVWLMAGALSVGYYVSVTPASVGNAGRGGVAVLFQAILYMLAQVGTVFEGFPNLTFLAILGGAGLLMLLINALYLLRRGERDLVALWLSIAAYALGAGYLIGIGRIPEDGFERVFFTWYTTAAMPFWVAWVALAVAVIWRTVSGEQRSRFAGGLLYLNIVCGAVLAILYVPSNDNGLNKILATQWRGVQESCIMRYIFVQGDIPFCYLQEPPELYQYNQLAARRLALYAGREPESILHAEDSAPVLIETHTPWLNTHIRDYFLDGVARERLYHIFPNMPETIAEIPNPPQQAYTDFSDAGVAALLEQFGELDVFWYIRREDHVSDVPAFWEALAERDYLILDTRLRNDGMLVSRVQRVPATLENSPVFGELLRLRAVSDVSETVEPCETITLNTFWRAEMDIPIDYSVSLRLLSATGEKVAQSDAGLGVLGTSRWKIGDLYADERTLAIPCELPVGDYTLTLGVYYYQAPGELLSVEGGEGSPIEPNTLFVSEIQIQNS